MLCKGLYDYFSTKKVSGSGGRSALWTPEVALSLLTIYSGATPGYKITD